MTNRERLKKMDNDTLACLIRCPYFPGADDVLCKTDMEKDETYGSIKCLPCIACWLGKSTAGWLDTFIEIRKGEEPMTEDKQKILNLLVPALQATRDQADLTALEYDAERELVTARYTGGTKTVNVAMDSGIAMIRDVLKAMR